ncbi:hypothetical protein LEN26_012335 [Aphanomyces euteiches]|nr:hypothetical protein LEN26_012335 [Aphanomyces euteiches]KAH9185473.1 hypothetical protein AeNC1_012553 [Aphanomyces euteiches]
MSVAPEKRVLDSMIQMSWDTIKCQFRGCVRVAEQRCPSCVSEFYCSDHKKYHSKSRHNRRDLDDLGVKVCEVCTDFQVEFYCSSCNKYQCFKCTQQHLHPVFPCSWSRGLCNAKLPWSNDFINEVNKYMVQYSDKKPVAQPQPQVKREEPASEPPRQQTKPKDPRQAAARPQDPRQNAARPQDPRQKSIPVKREVISTPPVAAPPVAAPQAVVQPVAAPPVVAAPPAPRAVPPLDIKPLIVPQVVAPPVATPKAAATTPVAVKPEPPSPLLPALDDDATSIPLPYVADNYLKGVMLDNYNATNQDVMRLDSEIRKLAEQVRAQVSSQSMQNALDANKKRNMLQQELEIVMQRRDESLAQAILYDPAILAKYDATHDPAQPGYKAPVNIPNIVQRFVPFKHGQCAKMEQKLVGLQKQWRQVQRKIDVAVAQHDIQGMESLQLEMDQLEKQMMAEDAKRGAEFVEISVFSERVRQLVAQYRAEQQ